MITATPPPAVRLRPSANAHNVVRTPDGVKGLQLVTAGKAASQQPVEVYTGAESFPRFRVRGDGFLMFGGGAADVDTSLARTANGMQFSLPATPDTQQKIDVNVGLEGHPRVRLDGDGDAGGKILFGTGASAPQAGIDFSFGNRFYLYGKLLVNEKNNGPGTAGSGSASLRSYPTVWVNQEDTVAGAYQNVANFTHKMRKVEAAGADFVGSALNVIGYYGGDGATAPTAAVGTHHGVTSEYQIWGNGSSVSETTPFGLYYKNKIGSGAANAQAAGPAGRMWLTDWIMEGPVGVQPSMLNGQNVLVNNHYNGNPSERVSHAIAITTRPGLNPPSDHADKPTYPVQDGLSITGFAHDTFGGSLATRRLGYQVGIRIGGTGGAWNTPSKIGTGIQILDFVTRGIYISGKEANADAGAPAIEVASGAGMAIFPNGIRGKVKAGPLTDSDFDNDADGNFGFDSTNNRLYVRLGGVWRQVTLT